MKDFTGSQLKHHKELLEEILLDVNNALKRRESLLEYTSTRSKYEQALIDRWTNPSLYYHFTFMDKGVEIVRDYRKSSLVYRVRCHNFNIDDLIRKEYRFFFNRYTDYGDYNSIDCCFVLFKECCIRLLKMQLGELMQPVQQELEIF